MTQEFKDWIVADLKKQPMATRASILQSVKFFPEEALQAINCCLNDWEKQFVSETGINKVLIDHRNDSAELLEAFKQNFITELSEITE